MRIRMTNASLFRPLFAGITAAAVVILTGCPRPESDPQEQAAAEPPPAAEASRAITYAPDDPALEWGPCPEFMPEGCGIAVLQGDPEDVNADVLLRMAPDTTIPEHWHTSAERMVLISGELHVDYEGQEPVVLTAGTYAYGPGGLSHETYCAPGEECLLFIAFEDPVDAIPVTEEPAPGSAEVALTWTHDAPDLEWGPCPEFMPEGCGIAVLQGDPEQPNADVFFRMAPGTTVPNHWHTSAERMVLVSGRMQVDYEGQEPVVLTPGTYAFGPAELPHETVCEDTGEDCVLLIAFEEPVDAHPVGLGH